MKNILKLSVALAGLVTLGSICSPLARATDLLNDVNDTVSSTKFDDMRTSRVSGGAALQSWVNSEPLYPGATTTATGTFYSRIFTFTPDQIGDGKYVEISIYDLNPGDYVSAFTGAYNPSPTPGTAANPTGGNANFLGNDLGAGLFGGVSAQYFQVIVPTGGNLIVVVTDASTAGAAETFSLTVSNFTDVEYTDATPNAVPEPSTWAMLGAGSLLTGVTVFRRRRATV